MCSVSKVNQDPEAFVILTGGGMMVNVFEEAKMVFVAIKLHNRMHVLKNNSNYKSQ
jgi:hypothetical protein